MDLSKGGVGTAVGLGGLWGNGGKLSRLRYICMATGLGRGLRGSSEELLGEISVKWWSTFLAQNAG